MKTENEIREMIKQTSIYDCIKNIENAAWKCTDRKAGNEIAGEAEKLKAWLIK